MNSRSKLFSKFGRRRQRRGVSGIIGGVFLVSILLTSFAVYFFTTLSNEQARAGYQIQSQQASSNKATEQFVVTTDIVSGNLEINVTNTGPIPLIESYWVFYCTSGLGCNSSVPVSSSNVNIALNPGDTDASQTIGAVSTGNTYRVDVISDRGNLESSDICTVTGTSPDLSCETTSSEDMEGFIRETGSIQIDFKSYAAIFPGFQIRNGIDQTGKIVSVSSVKGYPANVLYSNVDTIFVQRLRNLDLAGQNLTLTRNTAVGLVGSAPAMNYICQTSGDPITIPPTAYVDSSGTVLEAVPSPYDSSLGWHTIHFCINNNPNGTIDGWRPSTSYSSGINPLFMLIRAKYSGTQVDYTQNIPYHAFTFNNGNTIGNLVTCLYSTNTNPGNCDAQTSAATAGRPYIYSAAAGTTVYLHVNTGAGAGTSPYYVEWLEQDGSSTSLATAATINANRNISITIPAGATSGDYIIRVTDSSNIAGTIQGTMYMTFHVT